MAICLNFSTIYNDMLVVKTLIHDLHLLCTIYCNFKMIIAHEN